MKRYPLIAITWLAFAAMFVVNILANYLPINGLTSGEISELFPNRFVPDDFTFSIWGIIYAWLLVFLGYSTKVLLWVPAINQRYQRVRSILPLFWLSCLLNSIWLISWHYLHTGLCTIIILALLATLAPIFVRLQKVAATPRSTDYFLVELPFMVYFGWTSVLTISSFIVFLVSSGWNCCNLWGVTCTIVLMALIILSALFMAYIKHRPAYSLVVAWALLGIYRRQSGVDSSVALVAIIGVITCVGVSIPELLSPKKGIKAGQ